MDYFFEFHWWYILIGVLFVIAFGKGKGGFVVKRFTADLELLDDRFKACRTEASYAIFKEGSPDHIEIEIENLFLCAGEVLEIFLDGKFLATATVEKDKEAEFDHWSDEGVSFPEIKGGEHLVIKYKGTPIFQGTFQSKVRN